MIQKFKLFEEHLKSDASGYEFGEFVYHVAPDRYVKSILKHGIKLGTGGTTNLNNTYEPRNGTTL